jgi:hypothetical protein
MGVVRHCCAPDLKGRTPRLRPPRQAFHQNFKQRDCNRVADRGDGIAAVAEHLLERCLCEQDGTIVRYALNAHTLPVNARR